MSTGIYERGKQRRLVAVVLSALLLRALIPAGFMPMAGAGGLSLGFCPGAGAMPPGLGGQASHTSHLAHASNPAHDHTRHAGGGADGDPGKAHHSPCLFSAGAATTFVSSAASSTLTAPTLTTPVERSAIPVFSPAILRAQSSRGPPILV